MAWREGGYAGRRCACGTTYLDPAPPPGAVDPLKDLHGPAFYALPARFKVAWLAQSHPAGRLLEVGCGDGFFLEAARDHGYDVAGIDAHEGRARRATERLGVEVDPVPLARTRFPAGGFDVVFHCDMLSHFEDPVAELRRMVRLLRPGGVLYFEVGVNADRRAGSRSCPDHRYFYTRAGLRRLLAAAGLEIERQQVFGLLPAMTIEAALVAVAPLLRPAFDQVRRARGIPVRDHDTEYTPGSYRFKLVERLKNALRYRLGAVTPTLGTPGTTLVIARPRR